MRALTSLLLRMLCVVAQRPLSLGAVECALACGTSVALSCAGLWPPLCFVRGEQGGS